MNMRAVRASVAGLVGGVLVGGAFGAIAQAPGTDVVKVCVTKKSYVVAANEKGRCPGGSKATKINRTGPRGPAGPAGPRGATAPTTAAGSASELIATRLENGSGDITMVALGESTVDEPGEWWDRYVRDLAAEEGNEGLRVLYYGWDRDNFRYLPAVVVQPGDGSGRTLRAYNGSRSGVSYDYHQQNFAAMFPVAPDVVYLASAHADRLLAGTAYTAKVQKMADTVSARFPRALFVAVGSSPQYAPRGDDNIRAHLSRITELRILASRNGWDYMPGLEAFRALPDGGRAYVEDDGVHPKRVEPNDGAQVLADTALRLVHEHEINVG